MAVDAAFTLTANDIFATLANMIISQQVEADNIGKHQTLVDKARVDGGLYGDRKIFYSTDALKTEAWTKDASAANLLALARPADPQVQAIVLDQFRVISLTVDNYLTKRAWSTEGSFADFNSVMLGWMRETKKIYEGSLYNVFIGTTIATGSGQSREITIGSGTEGQDIAKGIADLLVEMGDYSRDFNDYGYLRSYSDSSIKVIWNSAFVNAIRKVDTPTIFHREGLVDKLDEEVLPAKYFGTINSGATAAGTGVRSAIEQTIGTNHYFPGEEIKSGDTAPAGTSYTEDADVICKVVVKLPPFMSSFEAGTSFFNPLSLTENHYLHFGYNTLAYLKNYPFITVKKASE